MRKRISNADLLIMMEIGAATILLAVAEQGVI
jgi:hypothetical protein